MGTQALAPGGRIGGYRLGGVIGEGASGVVFAARDCRGEDVAVKVLRRELAAEPKVRSRFMREARLAQRIASRHVAPIMDVGETDGLVYLVQPLYEGGSLAARLRSEGALGAVETAGLAAQVARGLEALHAAGIVHRDLKPSNILFADDRTAVITDFGLARAGDSTRLTFEGQLLGTPHYLAPELIEGHDATPASDLYALGCLLYECATGTPPFAAHRVTELAFAHLVEPPPDPRERAPELAADFALALLTALEKNPSSRPTTPTALARMLHVAGSAPHA